MSKIICDVCGTSYPDTSNQCPICGCVHSADMAGITADVSVASAERSYTHVKGGRFSKSNVRKRNRASQAAEVSAQTTRQDRPTRRAPTKKKSNASVVVIAIILLLAILALVLFLTYKFFWPFMPDKQTPDVPQTEPSTSISTAEPTVPCEGVTVDVTEVVLDEVGAARMVYATTVPANTTDSVHFTTSDPSVAVVNEKGKIEAVGPGEAVITISCGEQQTTCKVICNIPEETTESTEQTTEATESTTVSTADFRLNRSDITFSYKGDKWTLYSGDIDVTLIEWTSDNENVATIENGTVIAIGNGMTNVHGEINGVKVSCIIRCSFSNSGYEGVGGHGGVGEDG